MPVPAMRSVSMLPWAALLLLGACGEPPTESSLPLSAKVAGEASEYTHVDLGWGPSRALSVSPTGQVVGYAPVAGIIRPVLWDDGVMTNLGDLGPAGVPLGPFRRGEATGINPSGQVVGYLRYPRTWRAFLWHKGAMTDLGHLGGLYSFASGINPAGQIVGWSTTGGAEEARAFLWENGVMTNLGTLTPTETGGESAALAINPAGVAVGYSLAVGGQQHHAVLWQNGVITDLGIPSEVNYATGINAAGQIVGYYEENCCGSGPFHAFLWRNGVTTDLGTLGGENSVAYGINEKGQVVGTSQTADGTYHAFLWDKGVMTDLGIGEEGRSSAFGISSNGLIAGEHSAGFLSSHAVLWRP